MREIRTSGSVGGEGGNILTYPAADAVLWRKRHQISGIVREVAAAARGNDRNAFSCGVYIRGAFHYHGRSPRGRRKLLYTQATLRNI
jgi:hypothetical protein